MALTDVNFSEGEGQDFLVELPAGDYDGAFGDIVVEPGSTQYLVTEVPVVEGGDGDIFIIGE